MMHQTSSLRILVLTKRQYMGKDLVDDRFGRFRELPIELARLGHVVEGLTLSYRNRTEGSFNDAAGIGDAGVVWHSVNLLNGFRPRLGAYLRYGRRLVAEFQPDILWACSDAYHAIFGYRLAKQCNVKCVIDLYDNYEAFKASRVPGVLPLFKRAVRQAPGVTCFSARLRDYIADSYPRFKPMAVVENGVREDLFFNRDRSLCRQLLGLPENAKIIGTAGALGSSRGIETLFRAFEALAAENPRIHLAVAGPRERGLVLPQGPRVHDLGTLPHDQVPLFINALDLAVICYRESAQGRYSFPQKAYEIIACRVPLAAAAVGTMKDLLQPYPELLFDPASPDSLVSAARRQLTAPKMVDIAVPTWRECAARMAEFFNIIDGRNSRESSSGVTGH